MFDIFDEDKVKLSKNGACITALTKHLYSVNNYGSIEIFSTEKGKYKWDIKVGNDSVFIGICSSTQTNGHLHDMNCEFYGLVCWGKKYHKSGTDHFDQMTKYGQFICSENTIISMYLDLNKRDLSFAINGEDQGVAFHEIKQKKDLKYRFMAQIAYEGCSVEIVNFEEM